ncbi:MAG: neutral/alkaline non-lysosomal ceramidase N-terminal domain-containing protein, partial [Anaerolineae bacterium]|nr:neutral/alkaline non-lysosomal ceramidase N-terminal domain-containing protein [Anaerolineae bacterium]
MNKVQAGVARVCITPPIGVELAGYGPFLNRRSESIHDNLYAEALVLDDGRTRTAIVTSDLIACDEAFVAAVRGRSSLATGIKPSHIMVSCIHSHTAPTARTLRVWGARDEQYLSILTRHFAGAIASAARQLRPARIGCGHGEHQELAWYRLRDGEGNVDPAVMVLRVDDSESGQPMAILTNYACHAVMLGPKTAISADYPGAVRRHVEVAFPGCVHMFANGACGDIDPVSNKDVWGQASFDDVDRAGAALATQVVETASAIGTEAQARIRCAQTQVSLPLETMTLEEAQSELNQREDDVRMIAEDGGVTGRDLNMAQFWRLWAADVVDSVQTGRVRDRQSAELQAI